MKRRKKLSDAQRINQTSGDVEYYTPPAILHAARRTMGKIDLDPFSSRAANLRVGAAKIFTAEDDGFSRHWHGSIWMNHPFGRAYNRRAIEKLEKEFLAGRVIDACCITYACTSEAWFQPLLRRPQCFLCPRTNYFLPDGSLKRGVTKGSVVTYYGFESERFAVEFASLGVVKMPHNYLGKGGAS